MHIPSEEIYREIFHESAGIWFVRSVGTDSHAILLKAPTNVLKAIMAGCTVKVSFTVDQSAYPPILTSCVQIYDGKDAPFMVFGSHINQAEHSALPEILNRRSTPLFLYDELIRNVAWAETSWGNAVDRVSQLILSFESFYAGVSTKDVQSALDNLQSSLVPNSVAQAALLNSEQVELTSASFNTIDVYVYGVNDKIQMFNALSEDEGGGLEQSTWQLLESLFIDQIYRSPQVLSDNGKIRELTDIFCFTNQGIFLFETKVSSVLNTSLERSTERRAKNIESQIEKALRQLRGAIKTVRSGQKIVTKSGVELNFNREIVPHGVVVISEMFPFINWDEITICLMKTALESNSMIHILDLQELRTLIGCSSSFNHFDYYLMTRLETVIDRKSAFIRTKFAG
ncbi:hypothetical protein ACQ4M3_29340 [Leptolyngbya sp. AN03gr2]|uniref:hypothetical protein n=1 Tax=unclassified Leptolyngbya TaxID=2650499 RepID=UPI003D3203C1